MTMGFGTELFHVELQTGIANLEYFFPLEYAKKDVTFQDGTQLHSKISSYKIITQDGTIIKSWNDLNSSEWPTPRGNQFRTARFHYQCVFSRRRIMETVFLWSKLSGNKELFPIDTDTDCAGNPLRDTNDINLFWIWSSIILWPVNHVLSPGNKK